MNYRIRRAFTILELGIVMVIIAILMSIILPMVSRAKLLARATETTALIVQLDSAIRAYHQDFGAYPGPLTNDEINATYPPASGFAFNGVTSAAPAGYDPAAPTFISGAENLVLGLCGGFRLNSANNGLIYDASLVGRGPNNLNLGSPKHFDSYIDTPNLSWRNGSNGKTGFYQDDAGSAADSVIPEFVDTFNDPMPILYLRARVGAVQTATPPTTVNNGIIQDIAATGRTNFCQYQLDDIIAYTQPISGKSIGVGRKFPQHGLQSPIDVTATLSAEPYNAFPYIRNASLSGASPNTVPNIPRQKDAYILISAGKDRTYGTADDITNFGAVMP